MMQAVVLRLFRMDLIQRYKVLSTRSVGRNSGIWALLLMGAAVQTIATLAPFVSWMTWPFIVFGSYQLMVTKTLAARVAPKQLCQTIFQLRTKPSVIVSLILYGLLSLVIFRGLTEALRLIPIVTFAGLIPSPIIVLLPYSFAEASALLFIAACSARLVLDERDPLIILSAAIRDLLLSPLSFIVIALLLQAFILTYIAVQMTMLARLPILATILGHGPYALVVLAWALGQSNIQTVKS